LPSLVFILSFHIELSSYILHRLQRLLVYKLFDSHYAPMLLFLNLSFSQLMTVYSTTANIIDYLDTNMAM